MSKISNSNWAKWIAIQGVITKVISKSYEHEAQDWFEITGTITPWIMWHKVQWLINHKVCITNFEIKNVFKNFFEQKCL